MILTPEEKAKMLVNKFKCNTRAFNETNGWQDHLYNAKQCALIAVDEILNAGKDVDEFAESYYQQVKTEIEKL